MKLIDRSPDSIKPEGMNFITRLRGVLEFGASWPGEVQAQQKGIKVLKRYLSDRFTLISNLKLAGLDKAIPITLVGPTGVTVIHPSPITGAFQAQGEEWLALTTGKGYIPTRPNLVLQTCLMERAIDGYLSHKKVTAPEAQGVLLFTNPRIFVEAIHSVVRVVMSDALEKFAAGLPQAPVVLNSYSVETIVETLLAADKIEPPVKPQPVIPASPPLPKDNEASKAVDVNFNRKQWIFLITLSVLLVCVLIAFIMILVNAG